MHSFILEKMWVTYTKPGPNRKGIRSPLPATLLSTEAPYPNDVTNLMYAWFDYPSHPYNQNVVRNVGRAFIADPRYQYARQVEGAVDRTVKAYFRTLRSHFKEEHGLGQLPPHVRTGCQEWKNAYQRKYRVSP